MLNFWAAPAHDALFVLEKTQWEVNKPVLSICISSTNGRYMNGSLIYQLGDDVEAVRYVIFPDSELWEQLRTISTIAKNTHTTSEWADAMLIGPHDCIDYVTERKNREEEPETLTDQLNALNAHSNALLVKIAGERVRHLGKLSTVEVKSDQILEKHFTIYGTCRLVISPVRFSFKTFTKTIKLFDR